MYTETLFTEKQFTSLKKKELLNIFNKNKDITIVMDNLDKISLTLIPGKTVGIKFTELILLRHLTYIPPHWSDGKHYRIISSFEFINGEWEKRDDISYKLIYDKLMSPLDYSRAVDKIQLYYRNFKQGKKTIIKDLTEDDINYIIQEMNKPID